MKTFTDSAGRTWMLSMTVDSIRRVRDLLDVNLLEVEKGDPPLLTRIGTDVILLCDVIYTLVQPQAEKQGISAEQFGAALGGEAILAAQAAFYDELTGFFRQLGRRDIASAAQKQQQMIALAVAAVEKRIEAVDMEAEVERALGPATRGELSTN